MDAPLSREDFLWVIGSLARLSGLAFDATLVGSRFPSPHRLADVAAALREFRIEARVAPTERDGTARLSRQLPTIGWRRVAPASPTVDDDLAPAHCEPVILIAKADNTFAVFKPGQREPEVLTPQALAGLKTSQYWLVRPRTPSTSTGGDAPGEPAAPPATFGIRTLLPHLARHRSIWRDVLLASLAIQLVGLGTPLLTQVVIDKVLVHHTISTLVVVGVAMAVFLLFNSGMTWVRQYLILHTGNRIDALLGSQVFSHLLRLPARYFEHRPTGTLIARLHGVETIREFLTGAAISLVLDLPFLLIFVAIMFYYSWSLALIALGFTAAIAAVSIIATPILRERLNAQFQRGARTQAFTTEYVAAMETVKSLQLEPTLDRQYGQLLGDYLKSTFLARQVSNSFGVLANGLEQAMTLTILVVGALIVMQSAGFTIGMLVAFQMFAGRMTQPLMRLVGLWQEFQQTSIAIKRLGDLMDCPTEPQAIEPSRASSQGPAHVEIEQIAFRYGPDDPWLYREFSLSLPPGKTTVLTGASGSGKSTMTKLLLGFVRPNEGRIRLDGHDIAFLAANELRAGFGVVPQETVLFSGTIFDNLRLAAPEADLDEIVRCCKLAEIHTTIEQLPRGYQTIIGEHGVGLSGGQRQRIAIARALLRKPRVLIFDEATSALDTATAESLARTVNALRGTTTLLFIAHHVPKGLHVDQIVRVGQTRVAGSVDKTSQERSIAQLAEIT